MLKGYVHIVESPSALDLLDGRTEGRMLSEALRLAEIPFQYNVAATAEVLEQCFRQRLIEGMRAHRTHPMFHMSMPRQSHMWPSTIASSRVMQLAMRLWR